MFFCFMTPVRLSDDGVISIKELFNVFRMSLYLWWSAVPSMKIHFPDNWKWKGRHQYHIAWQIIFPSFMVIFSPLFQCFLQEFSLLCRPTASCVNLGKHSLFCFSPITGNSSNCFPQFCSPPDWRAASEEWSGCWLIPFLSEHTL